MFLRELAAQTDHIKGAGPASVKALTKAGINSVAALLCYYPRDWEDRSRIVPLADYGPQRPVCTVVRVIAHDWFGFGATRTLKIHVEDESARAVLVCFNRPFLEKQLVPGMKCRLWGRFYYKYGELQSSAFEFEPAGGGASRDFGRVLPVYPLSAGLNQGLLRRLVHHALLQYAKPLEDELPQAIIERDGLLPKSEAVRACHFPGSMEELDRARKTLIYEELFYLEMIIGRRALERRSSAVKETWLGDGKNSPLQERLLERLPFSLTTGQSAAIGEINRDMDAPYPMARLLQGDVGSGKTLVAFLAALRAVEPGGERGQAAIMAPTELLARQHAE
ncbi:MAG: DEAD/DEAH box helicase, partial [Treponema sp.]|nr:DEAD/DEAH box helicase [Treponema sp.]